MPEFTPVSMAMCQYINLSAECGKAYMPNIWHKRRFRGRLIGLLVGRAHQCVQVACSLRSCGPTSDTQFVPTNDKTPARRTWGIEGGKPRGDGVRPWVRSRLGCPRLLASRTERLLQRNWGLMSQGSSEATSQTFMEAVPRWSTTFQAKPVDFMSQITQWVVSISHQRCPCGAERG